MYLDTSVIGGYFDEEFERETRILFQQIRDSKYDVFISSLTEQELENAPEKVKELLKSFAYTPIKVTPQCRELAKEYVKENVVGKTSMDDCTHIATATINNIDILVSWNFKHIVNFQRIRNYNYVNLKNGYKQLNIHSPKEIVYVEPEPELG